MDLLILVSLCVLRCNIKSYRKLMNAFRKYARYRWQAKYGLRRMEREWLEEAEGRIALQEIHYLCDCSAERVEEATRRYKTGNETTEDGAGGNHRKVCGKRRRRGQR